MCPGQFSRGIMDRCERRNSKRRAAAGKKLPRVPIKTYKWEDVRRSRRRGGYPWTYLYKEEFHESAHPEDYKMDGLKKNKTSSASSASDSLDIKEITEDDVKGLEGIDSSYVVIESPILLDRHMGELIKDPEVIIESADSSDNISQYLDKEERGPERRIESTETLTQQKSEEERVKQIERAKSEEPKRKRKLSAESNYSRMSLSKLGVMKRLKDAKEKIKLPKLGGKSKEEKEVVTKTVQQPKTEHKPSKNENPVYIYIPLKPPEGEQDEFSHLEFEEKTPQTQPVPEVHIEVTEEEKTPELEESPNVSETNGNTLGLNLPEDQEDDVSAIIFLEGEEGCDNKGEYDIIAVDIDENSKEMKMSQITNTEVRRQVLESIKKVESQPDIAGNKEGASSLSRSSSRASKTSKTSIRKRRAKSMEPEKKRRGSIDSSYSRKSLSRIGLLKKLKQFHIPFVKSESKKSISQPPPPEVETQKQPPKPKVENKDQKPVYIHIPLKPPEGQTDEFSHLEFETAAAPQPKPETNDTIETVEEDLSPIDSPETSKAPQFIVLTPPSDDELLDRADIPETPSSETGSLFQFGDLQQLAKKAVDQVLESVDEEAEQKPEEEATTEGEKVTIDEEDGLKSVPSSNEEIKSNLKSKLKGESSPVPKKKVSFKRRKSSQVSQESKDDGYEEIQAPSSDVAATSGINVGPQETTVDVCKTDSSIQPDLQSEKLVESSSFEEDHNRWSKIRTQWSANTSSTRCTKPEECDEELAITAMEQTRHGTDFLTNRRGSLQAGLRSVSEGGKQVERRRNTTREGSVGSSASLDVRCACQYFQCDSLLPEKSLKNSRPGSRVSQNNSLNRGFNKHSDVVFRGNHVSFNLDHTDHVTNDGRDHEYEPVNPPDERTEASPQKSHVSEVLNPSPVIYDDELDLTLQDAPSDFFAAPSSNLTTSRSEQLRASPSRSLSKEREPAKPSKFQTAIKDSATKFKTKLQGIKKPSISLPSRPKFQKPNFKRPNINLPKLPDISSTFRRTPKAEDGSEARSGEVKAAEDASGKGLFDFSTYPRIFKKKKRDHDSSSLKEEEIGRSQKKSRQVKSSSDQQPVIIRIPLHSEDSMDQENGTYPQPEEILEVGQLATEDATSPGRYREDIETDDEEALQRERQEKHREAMAAEDSRWDHGNFYRGQNEDRNDLEEDLQQGGKDEEYVFQSYDEKDVKPEMVTDLDLPEETPFVPTRMKGKLQQNDSIDTNHSREVGSSVSSLGLHRRGVLEEIDSDQFFLREKGISQDNIDMGKYLSTEIREAFRSPTNALADINSFNYEEVRTSNQSLPETKRKQVKKPKRRKTPHASQERLRYEPESDIEDYNFMPPIRPKRKSKRRRKQEVEDETTAEKAEYSPEEEEEVLRHYENHQMEGIEHPHIQVSEPYNQHRLHVVDHHDAHRRASEPIPAAPPRKHKSLKSLNASEHESIFEEYENKNAMNGYANEDVFMSPETEHRHPPLHFEPPRPPKPPSRSRSKTRSMSRTTSLADRDSILGRMDSIMFEDENREPVVEEPCVKDLRDAMGYAIVDKNQNKNWEHKFCTVPRSQGGREPPERPLRNYSTLGPSRPARKGSKNMTDEEKENVDISQYIEIEDDRDLQSGEVIQKIQNRPLPAPPRPPRSRSKPLSDITSRSNVEIDAAGDDSEEKYHVVEQEMSTQTEPLPSDFECEEMIHEETDKIMTPSALRKNDTRKNAEEAEPQIQKILITPTKYSYEEETITHGQLLVEPLNGARILPDSDLTQERVIKVTTSDEEEASEVPEHFNSLKDPGIEEDSIAKENTSEILNRQTDRKETTEEEPVRPPRQPSLKSESLDVLKTQKLQVSDLDVDRLTVNELVANKIVVSEIESGSISSHDIISKSGTLKLADLELQPELLKKFLEQLKEQQQESQVNVQVEEKKTPMKSRDLETSESLESTVTLVPPTEEDQSNPTVPLSSFEDEESTENVQESTGADVDEDACVEIEEVDKDVEEIIQEIAATESTPNDLNSEQDEVDETEEIAVDSEEQISLKQFLEENSLTAKVEEATIHQSSNEEVEEAPPAIDEEPPVRPPRATEKKQSEEPLQLLEPEVDDEPPPRPPQPEVPYIPSQPPPSFYALRAQRYVDDLPEDIPSIPRRKRHHRPATMSRSTSSESSGAPMPRRRFRSPEPSIPQLTVQLAEACSAVARNRLKRLIDELNKKISSDPDAENNKQNVQVVVVVLLVLIVGLLLLGYGDGRTVHLHHWEYFNPPTDL